MGKLLPLPPHEASDNPIFRVIEELSRDTPNMAWLRKAGPIARRLNEEALNDPEPDEAA